MTGFDPDSVVQGTVSSRLIKDKAVIDLQHVDSQGDGFLSVTKTWFKAGFGNVIAPMLGRNAIGHRILIEENAVPGSTEVTSGSVVALETTVEKLKKWPRLGFWVRSVCCSYTSKETDVTRWKVVCVKQGKQLPDGHVLRHGDVIRLMNKEKMAKDPRYVYLTKLDKDKNKYLHAIEKPKGTDCDWAVYLTS